MVVQSRWAIRSEVPARDYPNELRRQKKKYGLVTACVGGGQGVAGVYELLN
jgi:hypothetical protein